MRIILNADDFGFSRDTVDATIDCFERGLLTSATIMPNMPATPHAIEYVSRAKQASFGVHLTLTGDGDARPVSSPSTVSRLVDSSGCLLDTRTFRLRALARRLDVGQLEREIEAQISCIRNAGVAVTHVDSHRHLHKFPQVLEALGRVLPSFGITRVRTVQDVYLRPRVGSPTYWLGRRWQKAIVRSFATTDHFYMPASGPDTDWHRILDRVSDSPATTIEIGVHPGTHETWRNEERTALEVFARRARSTPHVFVSWCDVDRRPGQVISSGA
jgi:predicted glycoside hydrolase/deacetylase ChbG (UPF0249 family)